MIESIASIITNFLIKRDVVTQKDKDIYKYGFEILLSSIIGILLVLVFGMAAGSLITSLIFILVFCSLRFKCGGYHANSYISCNIVFVTVFMVVLLIEKFSENVAISPPTFILIFLLGLFVMYKYAPVENVNKPLDEDEKKSGKRQSFVLYIVWWVVGVVLYKIAYSVMVALAASLLMVIILMLVGFVKERKIKYAENRK